METNGISLVAEIDLEKTQQQTPPEDMEGSPSSFG